MSVVFTIIFSFIAATGAVITVIVHYRNRRRLIIQVETMATNQTLRITVVNKQEQQIALEETGIRLSNGEDIIIGDRLPEYMGIGHDIFVDQSIVELKKVLSGRKVDYVWISDTNDKHIAKTGIPMRIKKMLHS